MFVCFLALFHMLLKPQISLYELKSKIHTIIPVIVTVVAAAADVFVIMRYKILYVFSIHFFGWAQCQMHNAKLVKSLSFPKSLGATIFASKIPMSEKQTFFYISLIDLRSLQSSKQSQFTFIHTHTRAHTCQPMRSHMTF